MFRFGVALLVLIAVSFRCGASQDSGSYGYDYVQFSLLPHSELDLAAEDGDGFSLGASWLFGNTLNLYLRRDQVNYDGPDSVHRFLGVGWRFALTRRLDGNAGVEVGRISVGAPRGGRISHNARRVFAGVAGTISKSWLWSARYHRDLDYLGQFEGFFYSLELGYRLTRQFAAVLELESGHYDRGGGDDPERDDLLLGLRYRF